MLSKPLSLFPVLVRRSRVFSVFVLEECRARNSRGGDGASGLRTRYSEPRLKNAAGPLQRCSSSNSSTSSERYEDRARAFSSLRPLHLLALRGFYMCVEHRLLLLPVPSRVGSQPRHRSDRFYSGCTLHTSAMWTRPPIVVPPSRTEGDLISILGRARQRQCVYENEISQEV